MATGELEDPTDPSARPSQVTDWPWLYVYAHTASVAQLKPGRGKWLLFVPHADVDEVWAKVRTAVIEGKLGMEAKVATAAPNPYAKSPDKHVICVYTTDSKDEPDVMRVRAALRELGFLKPIAYKTDEATSQGKYEVKGNKRISKYFV